MHVYEQTRIMSHCHIISYEVCYSSLRIYLRRSNFPVQHINYSKFSADIFGLPNMADTEKNSILQFSETCMDNMNIY